MVESTQSIEQERVDDLTNTSYRSKYAEALAALAVASDDGRGGLGGGVAPGAGGTSAGDAAVVRPVARKRRLNVLDTYR